MRRGATALLLMLAVMAPGAPTGAQDASPGAQTAPATPVAEPTPRDLYLDMPYTIGGYDPEIVMTRGQEHFANLQPGDPADDRTRAALETMLAEVGAEIDDMDSGYALVSQDDLFAFVVSVRIDGIEPGSLLPAYEPILLADLQDPTVSQETISGKDVDVVTSVGEADEYVALYVYDSGDTLWLVQGPEDVVEVTLRDLP